jgi:hypothetical protein
MDMAHVLAVARQQLTVAWERETRAFRYRLAERLQAERLQADI